MAGTYTFWVLDVMDFITISRAQGELENVKYNSYNVLDRTYDQAPKSMQTGLD